MYSSRANPLFTGLAVERSFRDPFRQVVQSPPRISGFRTPITGPGTPSLLLSLRLSRDPSRDLIFDPWGVNTWDAKPWHVEYYTHSFLHVFAATDKVRAITRQLVPIFRYKLWHNLVLHGFYVDSANLEYGSHRGDIAIMKNWLHDLYMIYDIRVYILSSRLITSLDLLALWTFWFVFV